MIFSARSDPAAKCDARGGKDVEDVRNQDTAAHQTGQDPGKKRDHNNKGITERVFEDHGGRGQPFGIGGTDIFLTDHIHLT